MKKILIVSTVSRQFYLFEEGNIEVLKSLGYEIHCAANFNDADKRLEALDIVRHHFDIQRSPFSVKNIRAYYQLKNIMKSDKFDVIHCHSPMGGVLARLAAKAVGIKTIIYTAHGFHFYDGAPLQNWLLYYNVEKYLSKFTDILITINEEDFIRAKNLYAKKVVKIPGIGVDTRKFDKLELDRANIRKKLGISDDTIVILSVGELSKRKNHKVALKALSELKDENFVYLICGKGKLKDYLKKLSQKLGINHKVKFLDFRDDVPEICIASDIFLFPSYQEGLPVSVIEAMAAGLPVIASKIRGNIDLIDDGIGGYLLEPEDYKEFAKSIQKVIKDESLRKSMGTCNRVKVKKYDKQVVKVIMEKLYKEL